MNVSENPFFVLKASARDRKSTLVELSEEAALHGDHESAVSSRSVLSNPRTRLAAEVAWFPGLSPKRVDDTLELIEQGRYPTLKGMNPLCRANFSAEVLKIYAAGGSKDLQEGIEELSSNVEEIVPEDVMRTINEDRHVAGIPAISEVMLVEAEIGERVRHFERTVTKYLEELPSHAMVDAYEALVSWSTNDGEDEGQRLIDALVDSYELKAGEFLTGEADRIKKLIEKAKAAADRSVPEMQVRASVNEIIAALRVWDSVAQPIQLAYKSRGLDHDESERLASKARSFGVHLFNHHDYLEDAKLISTALRELFSEVVAVNEQIQDDIDTLNNIAIQRAERQRHEIQSKAEYEREITYETTFGRIFKDKFRISPSGFDYKGTLTPLENISGVRWGAVRNSVNGVPTGTDYFFGYSTPQQSFDFQPNERQYQEIIQRAWRAACVPILLRWIEDWSKGRDVTIGGVAISDTGLMLRRGRLLREDEVKFFPWGDLKKGSHNGYLSFLGKSDSRFKISFSYKDVWNIHIFDFAIDKVWEGKPRLSKIFGD